MWWNYLRVRGEYRTCGACERFCGELPPRARRIHCVRESIRVKTGTTSACAENTGRYSCWSSRIRNYLRVRGEYIAYAKAYASKPELPPRARRIPEDILAGVVESGTTSACAENTQYQGTGRARCRNYLRVRGEYNQALRSIAAKQELPPRARRIQHVSVRLVTPLGTTSACAENTHRRRTAQPGWRNYLRVRGEYAVSQQIRVRPRELPPRARRIHLGGEDSAGAPGTTSACAENTIPR